MPQTDSSSRSTILVAGGNGNSGVFVVNALLESGNFDVILLTRPESEGKHRVKSLKEKGAEIRFGDISKNSVSELEQVLKGVKIVLSMVSIAPLDDQKKLFQAAKNVGVERVVPSDFATPTAGGGRLKQRKLGIRSFIKDLGIGYTFIDVGWWMELILPYPIDHPGPMTALSRLFVGSGGVRSSVTRREDIGTFVARILADPRTLNTYIFCHGDVVTMNEVYAIAEKVAKVDFSAVKAPLPAEAVKEKIAELDAQKEYDSTTRIFYDYGYSMYVLGENTVENAKQLGALDARELYPDFKPSTLEEFAVQFYKEVPPIEYDM
ncbi:hypothetical protein Clacol_004177 [Clathrus columnatus]|uniref:NmrA-like domain-containing protein n=1 Tax=Clathrus columnatus TaxID=1419009 RepID=A0AAV5A9V5_9AGAM|nr:hypothetical protein Clacol_004177 [Clathrus columnatus]